jgi:FKBP-type peptidyl-prolyl cis-trans isomerase 2
LSGAEVGMQVILWWYIPAKIVELNDKEVVFDANHELAWETLVFDITIKSIE